MQVQIRRCSSGILSGSTLFAPNPVVFTGTVVVSKKCWNDGLIIF